MNGQQRIHPVSQPTGDQAAALEGALTRDGRPLNIFLALAHNPGLLARIAALGAGILNRGSLPERLRELVILRVAARTGCRYEFAQHTPLGRAAGLSDAEIEATLKPLARAPLGVEDLEVLQAVDELLERVEITDATWTALVKQLDVATLIELIVVVGFYRMLAGFLRSARIELEPGVETVPFAESIEWP